MVDIIGIADSMKKVEEIANGRNDIRRRDILDRFLDIGIADDIDLFFSVFIRGIHLDGLKKDLVLHHSS
ncbi:Uncharacterised protein [Mycobacteroides abscessus subsp. abscessus]|nr:Uncharacterised protein [Mycobacteroides abscessus subsp. abscessus]